MAFWREHKKGKPEKCGFARRKRSFIYWSVAQFCIIMDSDGIRIIIKFGFKYLRKNCLSNHDQFLSTEVLPHLGHLTGPEGNFLSSLSPGANISATNLYPQFIHMNLTLIIIPPCSSSSVNLRDQGRWKYPGYSALIFTYSLKKLGCRYIK